MCKDLRVLHILLVACRDLHAVDGVFPRFIIRALMNRALDMGGRRISRVFQPEGLHTVRSELDIGGVPF